MPSLYAAARRWQALPLLALLLLAAPAPAATNDVVTLKRLQDTFARELQKVQSDVAAERLNLRGQFAAALAELEKRLQSAGDLDPLLGVRTERARFEKEQGLRPEQAAADGSELARMQKQFLAAQEASSLAEARRVKTLSEQYDSTLLSLQERLTREGVVEVALAVKQEREAARQRPEVTAAQFVLAEAASRAPAPRAETAPAPAPAATKPAPESALKFVGSTRNHIDKRYRDLCDAILARDWTTATSILDPGTVQQHGTQAAANWLRMTFPFLRAAENLSVTIKSGDIDVAEDGLTARLVPKARYGNEWHDLAPTQWVLVDGEWYLKPDAIAPVPARQMFDPAGDGGRRRAAHRREG